MWFFFGLLAICLTIIVLFRMYLDLREGDRRHIRIVQNDAQSYDKYKRITQQEALTELTKLIERRALERAPLPPLPEARVYTGSDIELDAEINKRLDKEYSEFMYQQERNAYRARKYR